MHQIGVGVLGPVFRTYDPSEDRLVAVKAFHLDMTPEQARTLVEALEHLVGVGLSHPGLAVPLAAGLEDGIAYLAQEYVAAESLDVAMRHYSPAQGETAMLFVAQMGDAIDAAHECGIVHGALHLRDVFVTPDEAHVTGFGVVTALEEIGLAGPIRRPYTAPEIITRRTWGGAADRFALAAIAYELLTGRRVAGTGEQVTERLRSVTGVADPEQLQEVFAMVLADDPEARYSSASRFVSALAAALGEAGELGHLGEDSGDAVPNAQRGPIVDDTEPPDLLAGLDLHPGDSSVDDVVETLAPSHTETSQSSAGADDLHNVDVHHLEDLKNLEAADDEGADDSDAIDAYEAGAVDESDGSVVRDDADGDDRVEEAQPFGRDLTEELEVPIVAGGRQESFAEATEGDGDDDDDVRAAGDPYVEAPVLPPPPRETTEAARPWWRGSGALIVLALAVGGVAYFVGVGRVPTDEPTDLVLGTDGEMPPDTVSREVGEAVIDTDASTPVLGAAGGARSTSSGSASGDADAEAAAGLDAAADAATRVRRGALVDTRVEAPAAAVASDAAPPAVAPTDGSGWILVRTEPPGAAVLLDGVGRGRTPLSLRDVAYGPHELEVSRPGFVTVQREVTVSASAAVLPVGIELVPADSAPGAGRLGRETGWLAVQSRPAGARVVVDGTLAGRTPVVIDTSVGRHEIRIEGDGYQPWVTTVEVSAADHARVNASLERMPR